MRRERSYTDAATPSPLKVKLGRDLRFSACAGKKCTAVLLWVLRLEESWGSPFDDEIDNVSSLLDVRNMLGRSSSLPSKSGQHSTCHGSGPLTVIAAIYRTAPLRDESSGNRRHRLDGPCTQFLPMNGPLAMAPMC